MEHFCDIILNLVKWFKRCHLKDFLPRALAALMFVRPEQFCNHVQLLYLKFGPVVQAKILLKKRLRNAQTDEDGSHNGAP